MESHLGFAGERPARIDLLLPDQLPGLAAIGRWLFHTPEIQAIWADLGSHEALDLFCHAFESPSWQPTTTHDPETDAHDQYFGVRRVEGGTEPESVLVWSLLRARQILRQESAHCRGLASARAAEAADRGLAALVRELGLPEPLWRADAGWARADSETGNPMRRWLHGHHVFAAITQGLIVSFAALEDAIADGRDEAMETWAGLGTALLEASAAAFEFTADFSTPEYEALIRPTMSPPYTPFCLSGLMSADHKHLAQAMRNMRPALGALAERSADRHYAMSAALHSVYDSHILVCERFVGAKPSLLTEDRTDRSGPSLLRQFQSLRQKPFQHAGRAQRLDAPTLACPFAAAAAAAAKDSASHV